MTLFKYAPNSVKDVDVKTRTVVVYFNKFGNIDSDRDMSMPGSFSKSIRERGRKGADLIYHLSNHRKQPEFTLGKPDLEEDSVGLKGTTQLIDTTHGNDVIKLYEAGIINQHSIGYRVIKRQQKQAADGIYFENQEYYLTEGSTVLYGANPETPTLEVKSLDDLSELTALYDVLEKFLRVGTVSDEMFKQIQLKHNAISELLKSTTEPVTTTQPDFAGFAERMKHQFSTF